MKINRKNIWLMFDKRCAYCGCLLLNESGKYMQIDHVTPIYRDWSNFGIPIKPENDLVKYPACPKCNNYKSTMSVETFRKELQKIPERLFDQNATYRNALRFRMIEVKLWDGIFWFEKYQKDVTQHEM
jgi:5-methylcytosine-specific restriction endonuclease McrA